MHLVVMGVSGTGKTAISTLLAAQLGYTFADGDDFHPQRNLAKMARGEPLTDEDRAPWLRTLAEWIGDQDREGRSTVLACSALKRGYRATLGAAAPQRVLFIHLCAPREVLLGRLRHRAGHFMPPELLESQLATLEPLEAGERGMTIDSVAPPADVASSIIEQLATK